MMMNEEEERRITRYFKSFPPGWRFHPTEEELIVDYLKKKLQKSPLPINLIKDVHLYNHNPWELTENFTSYGGNEFYFFTPRDRKYEISPCAKRVAGIGYWKSSSQVIPIYDSNGVEIGSKCLLVFYKGKVPNVDKTSWVMHEYKAKDEDAESNTTNGTIANVRAAPTVVTRSATGGDMQLDEWVLCKIYERVKEDPAATPAAQETPKLEAASATVPAATPAAQETPKLEAASAIEPAVTENHLNIMEAKNALKYIYPGSDINFGEDMVYFWRSNKVVGKIFKRAEEEPAAAPIEYREEQNYDVVMFNMEEYLVFPAGIDSSKSLDP